jgi:hypothetical protein
MAQARPLTTDEAIIVLYRLLVQAQVQQRPSDQSVLG